MEQKEKIGTDLKEFISNTIEGTVQNHLEGWAGRYAEYKRVSQVRFDLNVNHDSSLEIEYAEEELKRKLNIKEIDFLVERFNIEVCKKCKDFINQRLYKSKIMKQKLISQIESFNAKSVWDIDKTEYYQLIGWDGSESWFLKYILETMTIRFLKQFLLELKQIN